MAGIVPRRKIQFQRLLKYQKYIHMSTKVYMDLSYRSIRGSNTQAYTFTPDEKPVSLSCKYCLKICHWTGFIHYSSARSTCLYKPHLCFACGVKMEISLTHPSPQVLRNKWWGTPWWLSWLSVRLWLSAQVIISQVAGWSPVWGSPLIRGSAWRFFSLPFPPVALGHTLSPSLCLMDK